MPIGRNSGAGFGGGAPTTFGQETYGGLGPDVIDETSPDPAAGGIEAADRLQEIIERASSWPIWSVERVGGISTGTYPQVGTYGKSMRDLALWIALRENDRQAIVELSDWEKGRPIHLDPLPEKISTAYKDMLLAEDPDYFAANKTDQDNMDEMVAETELTDELGRGVDMQVSEGEFWWRSWTDLDASEWPLFSVHSRTSVIPLFVGRKTVAVAFIDDVLDQEIKSEHQVTMTYYRHIEIQAMGYVRNLLYKGTLGGLGDRMDLRSIPETEHLEEDWEHGLPIILAGRVPNKLGRDFRLGISHFQGVRDLLMDLIEARTIMAENARLVLKARMVVPANAVDSEGNFDASKDIIISETLDEDLDGKRTGNYAVLEYNFRANELIQHKNELVADIMTRCGLAEQFTGGSSRGGEGQAFTGTALRTRLIPTIQAAKGVAKGIDKAAPKILQALAMLSALGTERGGCGKSWSNADGDHHWQRAVILPEDVNEKVQRHVMAVQGEVESVEVAVEDLHPEWDDDEIKDEVDRIREDRQAGPSFTPPGEDPNVSNDIPNVPPGGPGSAVPGPSDVVGSRQPGAGGPVDGQSPGRQPPQVTAGGPS